MKTTIIFILMLFCQFANGQMNQKAETFLDTVYYQIHDMGMDADSFTHKQYIDAKILEFLVSEYTEYSKECYADSSLYHHHKTSWNDMSCYRQTGNLAIGYSYELVCKNPDHFLYTHKEPDFPGFMKWLQNKVK